MNERFHLVCPVASAGRKVSVALAQLKAEEIVHLARSSSVRQHIEAAGAAARTSALEVEHLATVAALVAEGLG